MFKWISDRLPEELRSEIYAWIWDYDHLQKNLHSMQSRIYGKSGCGEVPHIVDKTIVGKNIALRLLKAFYGLGSALRMFMSGSPCNLRRNLTEDPFEAGFTQPRN